jgi:hypothetical protein
MLYWYQIGFFNGWHFLRWASTAAIRFEDYSRVILNTEVRGDKI